MSEAPTHSPAMKFLAWIVMADLRWQSGRGRWRGDWFRRAGRQGQYLRRLSDLHGSMVGQAAEDFCMTKTIVCFGDSNTYGTPPLTDLEDSRRFDADTRWPGAMARTLGPEWRVIEEGLPGRTTVHDDPIEGFWKNGIKVLPSVIESHRPF